VRWHLRQASHPEGDSEEIRCQMKCFPLNFGRFIRPLHQVPSSGRTADPASGPGKHQIGAQATGPEGG
jgi:hypothetical protein